MKRTLRELCWDESVESLVRCSDSSACSELMAGGGGGGERRREEEREWGIGESEREKERGREGIALGMKIERD